MQVVCRLDSRGESVLIEGSRAGIGTPFVRADGPIAGFDGYLPAFQLPGTTD